MKNRKLLLHHVLVITILALTSLNAYAANSLKEQLKLFLEWFPGEYDNHEQVWQQGIDEVSDDEKLEHIHHIFAPVEAPKVGKHLFFVKQYMDDDPSKVYRQRLYQFSKNKKEKAIQLTIYSFHDEEKYRDAHTKPELLNALSRGELKSLPGCEVYWTYNGEFFEGKMKERACNFVSQRSGKRIFISDDLRLTEEELWIRDVAHDEEGNWVFGNKAGLHHKNRKVRFFSGWAAMKKAGRDAGPEDKDWHFIQNIRIHNEGQIYPLKDKEGNNLGYSVQIARLTYQNTKTPILKLGFIDDATGKTVAYTWTEPNGKRVGMNLKWLQAGFVDKE